MKIRMYNVGFGDCCCLRDRKSNLLVDFGTNNRVLEGRTKREVFDRIISDLTTIENKNFLLTHFHLDHLSGLLYMMRKGYVREFGKMYLPDVFSEERMSKMLALLLLADLVKDSYLPSKQVSLYALAEALCRSPQKIELLSRGSEFEGKYQALWPEMEQIYDGAVPMTEELKRSYPDAWRAIVDYSEKLRQIVWKMSISQEKVARESLGISPFELEQEFLEIRQSIEFGQMLLYVEEKKMPLGQLKQKISIVFQNARDGEWNLLFPGDVPKEYMEQIARNFDGKLPLYEHYWCMKAPHHGTHSHYFDFRSYSPENLLISNGIYHANSKKKAKASRTSGAYAGLFYIPGTTMHCTNCDCCEGYENGCTCKEKEIVAPRYYRDI